MPFFWERGTLLEKTRYPTFGPPSLHGGDVVVFGIFLCIILAILQFIQRLHWVRCFSFALSDIQSSNFGSNLYKSGFS